MGTLSSRNNSLSDLTPSILENLEYIPGSNLTSNLSILPPPAEVDEFKLIDYYLTGVASIVIVVLGLIGNILTIVVLTKRTMRSSTNCYLRALAVWDSVVLIVTLFLIGIPSVSESYDANIKPFVVVYIYPAALVAQTATIWLTVSFTVERYIAVCHPLRAASMCTIARARIVILAVSVFSFIYNASRWFEYEIVYQLDPNNETLQVMGSMTDMGRSKVYHKVYFLCLYLPIMCFIPLTSLAVINIFLILAVKRSQRQRRDMNVRQSRENNVTLMLVSVVVVFMICQVPALIYNMAYAIDTKTVAEKYAWRIVSILRNYLVTLNSAINFMLYCAFGQKFRRIFIRTFCQCLLSEEDFSSLTYHGTVINQHSTTGKYCKMQKGNRMTPDVIDMTSSTTAAHASVLSRYSSHSSFDANSLFRKNLLNKSGNEHRVKTDDREDIFCDKNGIDEKEILKDDKAEIIDSDKNDE